MPALWRASFLGQYSVKLDLDISMPVFDAHVAEGAFGGSLPLTAFHLHTIVSVLNTHGAKQALYILSLLGKLLGCHHHVVVRVLETHATENAALVAFC